MDEKVLEELLAVRSSGVCNMLSLHEVQRAAFDRGFYQLVNFIEENRADYVHFIMTGEMPTESGA